MIILAVIRRDYELLLVKTSVGNETEIWTLPHFEISDEENPFDFIIDKCQTYNVTIEPKDIYFHNILNGREVICFDTQLLSCTYSTSSENACWMHAANLEKLAFIKEFSEITDRLINEYRIAFSISKKIEIIINDLANEFIIKIDKSETPSSYSVFVRNDYGNYCPYIFSVEYIIHPETNLVDYRVIWPITRMFAKGDKTDLYILFSSTMSILLKCIYQKDVYIDYLSFFVNTEINTASIVFISNEKANDVETYSYQQSCLLQRKLHKKSLFANCRRS